VNRGPRVTVVTGSGELDAYVATELEVSFDTVAGDERLVADLGAVSFIDSTTLGLLVRLVREVEESDGNIRVVLPRGFARRIFDITMLDRALPVSASLEDAVAELDGRQ
jgi:anti-sigma B factor antagonist